MNSVLVLNADYTPLEVVSWQKAVAMLLREKVRVVEEYAGKFLRSPSITMGFPAVVARVKYVKPRRRVRFSRKNILARDRYRCQYCGLRPVRSNGTPKLESLTIDHVVPRAQSRDGMVRLPWNGQMARVTSWENVLTACSPCNSDKADRTPEEAGLPFQKKPKPPTPVDLARMSLYSYSIPTEWREYVPLGSPWRDYWTAELTD